MLNMKIVKNPVMALIALCGFSSAAFASDANVYVAVQGGALMYSNQELANNYGQVAAMSAATFTPTASGDAFGAGTGHPGRALIGLQFNSKFAVEVAGINFGTTTYSGFTGTASAPTGAITATSKAIGSSINLVSVNGGSQPGDYVALLVKVGLAAVRSTSTVTATGPLATATKTPFGSGRTVGLTFGLGIQSDISENFAVRLDWDSYVPPSDSSGRFNTLVLGLNLKLF